MCVLLLLLFVDVHGQRMAEQVDGQFVQSEEHLVADGAVERTIRHLHEADLERIDTVKVGLAAQGTGQHLGAHCSRDVVNCDFS